MSKNQSSITRYGLLPHAIHVHVDHSLLGCPEMLIGHGDTMLPLSVNSAWEFP